MILETPSNEDDRVWRKEIDVLYRLSHGEEVLEGMVDEIREVVKASNPRRRCQTRQSNLSWHPHFSGKTSREVLPHMLTLTMRGGNTRQASVPAS